MRYSAEVGLTAHLDQTLFPTPGPLHPNQILSNLDQYKMYDPWLELHREGRATVRLQINFLSNQTDPALPELHERLRNQFQFFGDDMVRHGSIGDGPRRSGRPRVASKRSGWSPRQRWRNENAVQNLAALQQVVEAYEQMNAQYGITDLRWMRAPCCREVTPELLSRLAIVWVRRADGRLSLGDLERSEPGRGRCVPHDRRSRHPSGPARRRRAHRTAEPRGNTFITRRRDLNSFGPAGESRASTSRAKRRSAFSRKKNAWFLRMEDKIGSIEPGKLADLVVLDRDYFAVPDSDIKKIRSLLTIVGGNVVHDGGALG